MTGFEVKPEKPTQYLKNLTRSFNHLSTGCKKPIYAITAFTAVPEWKHRAEPGTPIQASMW